MKTLSLKLKNIALFVFVSIFLFAGAFADEQSLLCISCFTPGDSGNDGGADFSQSFNVSQDVNLTTVSVHCVTDENPGESYFTIERTSDDSVLGVSAPMGYYDYASAWFNASFPGGVSIPANSSYGAYRFKVLNVSGGVCDMLFYDNVYAGGNKRHPTEGEESGNDFAIDLFGYPLAEPEPCAGFCNVTFNLSYDGTQNTTGIWSDRNEALKAGETICTSLDLYMFVGESPTYVYYAYDTGGCVGGANEMLPLLVANNTVALDNATLESAFGYPYCSTEGFFCTQNISNFNGLHYIHNETRFDVIGGYIPLYGFPVDENVSEHRYQVIDFYVGGFDSNSDIILNESLVFDFSVGLWSPMKFYKNTGQGIAQVVLPKTPTYQTTYPNVGCYFGFALNGSGAFPYTAQEASGNCTRTSYGDVAIAPLSFFDYSHFYRIMPCANKLVAIEGRQDYFSECRRNERGSGDNPLWTAINFTEFSETSCNLTAYYPLDNGTCVLFGEAPPFHGYQRLYTTGDFVNIVFDGLGTFGVALIGMAGLVLLTGGYLYVTGKIRTGKMNK